MEYNISPQVRAAVAARATGGQVPPVSFKPERMAELPKRLPAPVELAPEPDLSEVPEGNAVQADPENDNPPNPPEDGSYAFQKRVVITPERAQHFIGLNAENNRRQKESAIARYSRDMRTGRWLHDTGETVKISADGELIDGQNRFHAVVRSQQTIVFDIAWNVPKDRMLVIDGQINRNTADDFKIHGVADRFMGGALVRWVLAWEKGNYLNHGGRLAPTRTEIRDRYVQEPHSFDQAVLFGRMAHHAIAAINANAAAMAFFLFSHLPNEGQEKAEEFFDKLCEGRDLASAPAVHSLQRRLVGEGGNKLNKMEQLVLMVKAWNAFRDGRAVSPTGRLVLNKDRLANDNFPMPV